MADWSQLGAALGGNSELSFAQGAHLGATTQDAMAQAAERVAKVKAQTQLAAQLTAAGVPESVAAASSTALTAGGGLGDVLTMLGKQQEQGFRTTAGAEGSTTEQRNAALAGVASGPVDPYKAVGAHGYQDIFHPDKGVMPLGSALNDHNGESAQIQILGAMHMLDANGQVLPGQEAKALDILHQYNQVVDVGGVNEMWSRNPLAAHGAGGPAIPPGTAAPTAPLGTELSSESSAPVVTPASTPPGPATQPQSTEDRTVGRVARIEGAKETAKMHAENAIALPKKLLALDQLDKGIDDFLAMPGFDGAYGKIAGPASSLTQFANTDIGNANAARNQLKGQVFLGAIQQMRGMGQLSNQEGMKVEQAYTMATTPNIDPATARVAWQRVKEGTARLRIVAAQEAGQAAPPSAAPASEAPAGEPRTIRNPQTGERLIEQNGQWVPYNG